MLPSREDDNWGIASRSFDVMHQAIKSRGKCSTKGTRRGAPTAIERAVVDRPVLLHPTLYKAVCTNSNLDEAMSYSFVQSWMTRKFRVIPFPTLLPSSQHLY